jgi:hypothetical protein
MNSVVVIFLLVFPGYFGVAVSSFLWGLRRRPAADLILEASVVSVLALFLLGVAKVERPLLEGAEPGFVDFLSFQMAAFVGRLTFTASLLAVGWTALLRWGRVRQLFQGRLLRSPSQNVLYDELLRWSKEARKREKNDGEVRLVLFVKGDFVVKGTLVALSDQDGAGFVELKDVDLYSPDLRDQDPVNFFARDSAERVLGRTLISLSEVTMVFGPVDDLAFTKWRTKVFAKPKDTGRQADVSGCQ